jgi:hypothetical protein
MNFMCLVSEEGEHFIVVSVPVEGRKFAVPGRTVITEEFASPTLFSQRGGESKNLCDP